MSRMLELIQEWEDRLEMGDLVTPEELCMNQTDVDPSTLRQYIEKLQKLNHVLEVYPDAETRIPASSTNGTTGIPAELVGYELKGSLGDSGMGVVVRASEIDLQRDVAIKFLPKMANANRFLREAQVLALLKHPNIVPIYHSQLRNGNPYFVMEYVTGGNLADRVTVLAKQPVVDVVRLMIKVTNAVHFAHGQGVIHRDLKPANILLDENGEPKVTDFGLAKLRGNAEEPEIQVGNDTIPNSTALTRTGTHVGTPSYMAPEQYVANEMSPQVDIWALGVILYECLTGNRPFQGKRFENLQPQVLFLEPPSMRSIRKEIPVALETIVQKCMKKSPAERYQSAAELAKDLERLEQPRNGARTFARIGVSAAFLLVPMVLYLVYGRHQSADSTPITMPTETKLLTSNGEYLNVVKPIQVQLSNGEKVDLIKPYVNPVGYRLLESADIRLSQRQEDGSLTVFHNNLCYMELLPSVGIDRYRITAKIRHDYLAATRGYVGIYHCYQQAVNSVGTLHCCYLHALSDPSQIENDIALVRPLFSSSFSGFIGKGGQQINYREAFPSHVIQRKDHPKGWHTIQLDVDHNDVTVHFDGKLLGSSNTTGRELNFQSQGPGKDTQLLLQANDFRFPTSGAVGLYIHAGCISVQNFSIEPLP